MLCCAAFAGSSRRAEFAANQLWINRSGGYLKIEPLVHGNVKIYPVEVAVECAVEAAGKGLMIGIELTSPCADLVGKALDKGLLINVTVDSVIRLLPPLIINEAEADQICDTICELVEAI